SPVRRPRFTVPSANRGVGCGGPAGPRPRPPGPPACAAGGWAETPQNAVNTTAIAQTNAPIRRFRMASLRKLNVGNRKERKDGNRKDRKERKERKDRKRTSDFARLAVFAVIVLV